jgi:hypothetical protein
MSEVPPLPPVESISDPSEQEEYTLLKGHFRTDGTYKSDEQLRSEYVHLTDEIINKLTNGVEVIDPHTGEKELKRPDAVVWLDKSARPVSWLTKELWPILAADQDGTVPELPKFYFANIDREQWVNTIDPEGSGHLDIDRVDRSIIRSLRSIFVTNKPKDQKLTEDLDSQPSVLDGKTVLIVDEVQATGRTLNIARKFFSKAFPDTKVAGMHWMGGITVKGGATGNADLPIWYKQSTEKGRGVGNRDEQLSRSSKSLTQRLGAMFLSTVLRQSDPASLQLRKEFKQLARGVKEGKVLYVPSLSRDVDDFDERAQRINGMSFEKFIEAKNELSKPVEPN